MDLINKSKLLAVAYDIDGPGIPVTDANASVGLAEKLISNVVGVLTIVGFLIFAIQIIFAGYNFLTAEGDKNKMEAARKKLTDGVLGIFIVVIALGFVSLIASLLGLGNVLDLKNFFSIIQ